MSKFSLLLEASKVIDNEVVLFLLFFRFIGTLNCSLEIQFAKTLALRQAVSARFLNGQRSITFFKVEESNTLQLNKILQALVTIAPVKIYNHIYQSLVADIHDMGDELNVAKMTKGYFIMSESVERLNDKLKFFS